jgi:ferric-dicitrate binding protein FerR (iron transport regulator)
MDAYKDLLDRILNDTATDEERTVFFKRLEEGELDFLMTDDVFELIKGRGIPTQEQEAWLGKLNEKVLASNNIVIPRKGRNRGFVWAAAAVILITTVAGILITKKVYFSSAISEVQQEVKPSIYKGKQLVNLPDGSTALLNDNSELRFTNAFGTGNREVILDGEALFDVTHNPAKPFIVHTGKVETLVLGTEFNVNAKQDKIIVTVVRGLVQVGDEDRVYGKIKPDEQIEVDVVSHAFVKTNTKAEEAIQWQKNFLTLNHVTFSEAAVRIEKHFNVKVEIRNEALKDCIVTAWFLDNENLQQIVKGITAVQQATAVIEGNTVVIDGGIGCK